MLQFKNIEQLKSTLKTQADCLRYYESIRFEEGYFCPHCRQEKHYKLKKEFSYRCANAECRKTFNVLTKTIFENTKIPLTTWFTTLFLASTLKKGISSLGLSELLGIRQATCWFMLHRIREGFREKAPKILEGEVEADGHFVGGEDKWKHQNKKKKDGRGRRKEDKVPLLGIVKRGGEAIISIIPSETQEHVQPIINERVAAESIIHTDEKLAYHGLYQNYDHATTNHFKKEYVNGRSHTGTVDGLWSHLGRMIYGTYHQVSKKHLSRYCDELTFRYNSRQLSSSMRFDEALRQSSSRLTYSALIQKSVAV